jgi:NADH-ubiquinone oxidoreductase chain 2
LVITSYLIFETLDFVSLGNGVGIFGGLFHATTITTVFQLFIYVVTAVILHLTAFLPRKILTKELSSISIIFSLVTYSISNILNKMARQYTIIEYPLILLFVVTGASFLTSSSDIVSIFLSIELQSYGLYLVCSLYRDSELSTSAGLTYFLLGGLSSCFILLGTSLLYVNSGTTSIENYYVLINLSNLLENNHMTYLYGINYMQFYLLIMSIGFLFKISAAPFHFWSPDVYDAIPTIVTTFVAIIAKISILVFLLELIHYTTDIESSFNWTIILLYSSFLSLIVGTVLGLNQSRIKRLLAYSTISHLGFILLALSINSVESIQAFMFYLMQYSITNLNAFILLISIGYSLYIYVKDAEKKGALSVYIDKNNSPIQFTGQLKGFFYVNPVLAISFAITIYSFVGIPPLVGFFAKQMVLGAALSEGYVFITIVAILTSVISAVYYLGIIKQMFFDKSDVMLNPYLNDYSFGNVFIKSKYTKNSLNVKVKNITLSSSLSIVIAILTLIIVLFMFNPQEWISLTNILALILFNS